MDNFNTLFNSSGNILMHGPGGTGKSYDAKKFIEYLKDDTNTTFVYLAPTGTAASNIGGMTIHSYFKLGIYTTSETIEEEIDNAVNRSNYKPHGLDLLIIDEISMVGIKLLSIIDGILRKHYDLTKPMGGVRCIFAGDFYQLPPVKDDYCYECSLWMDMNFTKIIYSEQKRYTCDATFQLLMRLRKNKLIKEDKDWLLRRVEACKNREYEQLEVRPILLFTRNVDVNALNATKLKQLTTKQFTHIAENVFKTKNKRTVLPLSFQNKVLDEIIDRICVLKVGASVLLYRNYDTASHLTNGRLGIITEIDEEHKSVRVKFSDGLIHDIRPKEYAINGPDWTLSRTQIPLRAAWAITNYKCQGMTLDSAIMKLADCFAFGQVYTTIARVVSVDKIFIHDIDFDKIRCTNYIEDDTE
jgi:ATP-dependent DNA helicase PIF1